MQSTPASLLNTSLIDVGALPAIAWKNGGGTTRTLAVSPEGAGFDDFIWRVSIAEVRQNGGFSLFPGVDRTILLLDGAGMVLTGSDGSAHALTTPFEPHGMRGEDAVDALLVNGPSRDFNVMVRRGRAQAVMQVWHGNQVRHGNRIWHGKAAVAWPGEAVFYCPRGAFEISFDGETVSLAAGWAFLFSGAQTPLRIASKSPDGVLIGALLEFPESPESEKS